MGATSYANIKKTFEGEKALELLIFLPDSTSTRVVYYLVSKPSVYRDSQYILAAYEENVGFIDPSKYGLAEKEAEGYFKSGYYSYYYQPRRNTPASCASAAKQLTQLASSFKDKIHLALLANDLAESMVDKYNERNSELLLKPILSIAPYCRFNESHRAFLYLLKDRKPVFRDITLHYLAFSHFVGHCTDLFHTPVILGGIESKLEKMDLEVNLDMMKGLATNFPYFQSPKVTNFLLEHLNGQGIDLERLVPMLIEKGEYQRLFDAVLENDTYRTGLPGLYPLLVEVIQTFALNLGEEKARQFAKWLTPYAYPGKGYSYLCNYSKLSERLADKELYPRFDLGSRYDSDLIYSLPELEKVASLPTYQISATKLRTLLAYGIVKSSAINSNEWSWIKTSTRTAIKNLAGDVKSPYFHNQNQALEEFFYSVELMVSLADATSVKYYIDDDLETTIGKDLRYHILKAKAKKAMPKKITCVNEYKPSRKEGN